jgi:poly-gamma-glutamate synthesis protein (capsule biosynthesis protein)
VILRLYAVGDIMLGEQPLTYHFGVDSVIKKKGTHYLFRCVKNIFKDGDIVIGNLEAPLSRNSTKKSYGKDFFRGDPQMAAALKDAHFNILSVANNHMAEHGEAAFLECVSHLEESGIYPVGIKNKPRNLVIKGTRITFLAYSCICDGYGQIPYNTITTPELIYREIELAKKNTDFIIVSLHWGREYCSFPSLVQKNIGRKIIDAGADIIIGSHPHVLQDFEMYKGKLILYSLGNFILDQTFIGITQRSAIASVTINTKDTTIECTYLPIDIDNNEYFPRPLENMTPLEKNHSVGNTKVNEEKYDAVCRKNRNAAKYGMLMQFFKNIHRYPGKFIIWILVEAVKRRTGHASTKT